MLRINLISSPRNVSTALMYSFAQRPDAKVVDEPFYGYYLSIRPVSHPGREEIIRSMETNAGKVVDALLADRDADILMIKNMAHHLIEIPERFYANVRNVLLIRNPRQLIASFAQVVSSPTMDDIGVRKQYELYTWLGSFAGHPLILDAGTLLKNPPIMLREFCAALGISFDEAMLSWKAGPREEDGIWAKYWYENVHRSTGFEVQSTSNRSLPDALLPLYEEALPLYMEMLNHSILPN